MTVVLVADGIRLVDNAFAAPGAKGCGPVGTLDLLMDLVASPSSPAGTNMATMSGEVSIAAMNELFTIRRPGFTPLSAQATVVLPARKAHTATPTVAPEVARGDSSKLCRQDRPGERVI